MHAIIPFDRFNPDDFSFCFGARPISPHERGSIRATRLRCAPQAAQAALSPARGGAANTLRYSGYVLGLAPLRAYARVARLLPRCGQYAVHLFEPQPFEARGRPQKSRSQIPASNQWLGGAVCVALGERRTERLNLNYSHEILIWCGTCDDGLASRNVSTPSL